MKIRMGTRGSALALAQSRQVASRLKDAAPGLEVESVVIETSGDLFGVPDQAQARAIEGGAKGLFVKEIEEALQGELIDLAVHSAKDLPGSLPKGLEIAAYPEREDPRDAFVGRDGVFFEHLKSGLRVATSSLRRQIQLIRAKPGIEIVSMRGNVDTRLRKLQSGLCDGLVLAAAGLKRLGRTVLYEVLPVDVIVPAPGQGALAVEVKSARREVADLVRRLDHASTRLCVELERAFLQAIGGGCSMPLGALAFPDDRGLMMTVFWSEPDGSRAKRLSAVCPDLTPGKRESFAVELAAQVVSF